MVAVIELVPDVPPKRAELSPLLDNRVEEGDRKEEAVPRHQLLTMGEFLSRELSVGLR